MGYTVSDQHGSIFNNNRSHIMPSGKGPGLGRQKAADTPTAELDAELRQQEEGTAGKPEQKPNED